MGASSDGLHQAMDEVDVRYADVRDGQPTNALRTRESTRLCCHVNAPVAHQRQRSISNSLAQGEEEEEKEEIIFSCKTTNKKEILQSI